MAGLDLGGKPLAAANASVTVPDDPLPALWQQVTVVREWRGYVHVALLMAHQIGPRDCMVVSVGTGRFPMGVTKATRQWTEQDWGGAIDRLGSRGWVDTDGAMTTAGIAERDELEAETDRLCAPIWAPIGDTGAARLAELILPIHQAFDAAGTYAALA
ncbi:MAG: hypothetical protein GY929_13230 [Actinomycetia bacterium]|nr:hypothetical protein [Actinomycetes bacterium]